MTAQGASWMSQNDWPKLQHLSLQCFKGSVGDVAAILDSLAPGELRSFELGTQAHVVEAIPALLNHPALRGLRHLNLGVPNTLRLIERLAEMKCPFPDLHTVDLANRRPLMMEGCQFDRDVEATFLAAWARQPVNVIRYPWPISTTSLLHLVATKDDNTIALPHASLEVSARGPLERDTAGSFFVARR
jgi:hypothetical protein